MSDGFDKRFWEAHWDRGASETPPAPANPALESELGDLVPGAALDAGCGEGTEAIWLASRGWAVTAADISGRALDVARARAAAADVTVDWIETDLSTWSPAVGFDLVTTFYAHPTIPQLDFYDRIAGWVKPGGTLLIVGHLRGEGGGHEHGTPADASVTADAVASRLIDAGWSVQTAAERERTLPDRHGHGIALHDVVVRATKA